MPVPTTTVDLALLGQPARPPVSRLTTPSFQPRSSSRSIVRRGEGQAVLGHLLGLGDHLRGVQQRLGRDAADVEAHPAERAPRSTRTTCLPRSAARNAARVAAGPGAQHQHLGVDVTLARSPAVEPSATVWRAAAGLPPDGASPVRRSRMGCPVETVSPTFTLTASTVPAAGAGTSMVALSDSSVISGSSAATVSPGLTWTSMTGTASKSPISGTLTSILS